MRHQKKPKITSSLRRRDRNAIKNTALALIVHEKVQTTLERARAARARAERLITKAKDNNLTARRALIRSLGKEGAVRKLMEELGPRYKERRGGYTRIVKLGARKGDGASLARLELV